MKNISHYLMVLLYMAAGINHFVQPQLYLAIMPPWLPYHHEFVFISGICELLFAILLIPSSSRSISAWLIIFLLMAVFPANIQMMLNYYHEHNPTLWIAIVRLPLQVLLIGWAYTFARKM